MNSIADRLRNIIVQGWAGMLYLLLLMSLTDLNELGMKGDFSALNIDPGVGGIWFVVIMSCINVLVQISVRAFDGTPFRWLVFVASVIYTILFIIHQIDHLSARKKLDTSMTERGEKRSVMAPPTNIRTARGTAAAILMGWGCIVWCAHCRGLAREEPRKGRFGTRGLAGYSIYHTWLPAKPGPGNDRSSPDGPCKRILVCSWTGVGAKGRPGRISRARYERGNACLSWHCAFLLRAFRLARRFELNPHVHHCWRSHIINCCFCRPESGFTSDVDDPV